MPASPSRIAAYRVLLSVTQGEAFAVDLLQGRELEPLSDPDRRLATAIVMGVLRWRGELDYQIEQISGREFGRLDLEVATILRMGVYQIRFLQKVPKPAAVNDSVELVKMARKRSAAGFVNAVLRKCGPPEAHFGDVPVEDLGKEGREAVQRAIPPWLFARWAARRWPQAGYSGPETALRLAWASTRVPPTTLNATAVSGAERTALVEELAREGVSAADCEFGRFALSVRSGNVLSSRAYREGRVAIQDEASQLVAELVSPEPGQRVLDLCAAPGMKAAVLAARMRDGELVASDSSPTRLQTLKRLLTARTPAGIRLHVLRLDATRPLPFRRCFDHILLDAPCSGTGTLARNPEIKWRLRERDIARQGEMQRAMLESALPMLAPGGRLVYATCSLEPEENAQVVDAILREHPEFRRVTDLARDFPNLAPLIDGQGNFRTRPDLHGMDGFCATVLARGD